MRKKEREYLEEVYRDCVEVEKTECLTGHGAGEGDLCIFLLGKNRRPFRIGKYA